MIRRVFGPFSLLGLVWAALAVAVDQGHKAWMLHGYGIQEGQSFALAPFLDIVLVWNPGISYGLFPQESEMGRWLLVGFRALASIALLVWLARVHTRISAVAIGLVMGGAVGNALDGIFFGAVADFFHVHVGDFSWYVFNIADVAIVAGVVLLLYEAFLGTGQTGDAA